MLIFCQDTILWYGIQHIQQQHSNSIQPWPWRRRRRPPVRYPIHSSLETKNRSRVRRLPDSRDPTTYSGEGGGAQQQHVDVDIVQYRSWCSFHSMSIWLPRDMCYHCRGYRTTTHHHYQQHHLTILKLYY